MSPILIKRLRTITGSGFWFILIPPTYWLLWLVEIVQQGPHGVGYVYNDEPIDLINKILVQLPENISNIRVPIHIFFILHMILLSIVDINSTKEKKLNKDQDNRKQEFSLLYFN